MKFSGFVFYKYLFFGFVLFFLIRLTFFIYPAVIKQNKYRKSLKKYLPFAEFTVWIVFIIWSMRSFFKENQYLAIGLLVVVLSVAVWGSWFLLKDYIAGLIFKTGKEYKEGETISLSEITGKIKEFKTRSLEVETPDGKLIHFPYAKILNLNIEKGQQKGSAKSHKFIIKAKAKKDYEDLKNNLIKTILNLPWVSIKDVPKIRFINKENNVFVTEITVFSLEYKYFHKLEQFIREEYE